ncbi:hypothetical protein KEM56_003668 [Ascosphaera pollenicola]|nr:hypothetical protein KEM56_003668 [Ascosphaera pollenicola]
MNSQISRWGSHSLSSAQARPQSQSRPAETDATSTTAASYNSYDPSLRVDSLEDPFTTHQTMNPFTDDQEHREEQEQQQQEQEQESELSSGPCSTMTPPPRSEEDDTRRCWICYGDETEDPSPKPEWRSPCPCALTAHESCLLDWLADIENSSPRRRLRRGQLLCPQCRSEIVVRRPHNYVVELVRKADVLAGKLIAPGLFLSFAGIVWAGCCLHGLYSFRVAFGSEMAHKMLMTGDGLLRRTRINVGIPLIPIILIFSRTRFADRSLPVFPIVFFALQGPDVRELDGQLWPPSPSLTFASLPYLRSIYNICYEKVFGRLERNWVAAVRPRAEEIDQDGQHDVAAGGDNGGGNGQGLQGGGNNNGHAGMGDNDMDEIDELVGFDLQIRLNLGDVEDDDDDAAMDAAAQVAAAVAANEDGQDPVAAQQQQQNNGNGNDGANALGAHEDILSSSIADTVLGALVFPAVSASMGSLLKLALPSSWTSPLSSKTRPGLLQSKWGRSVVGGCLFVLFKDVVRLYCRWKIAQSHRKRKVLNYDRRGEISS